MQSILVNWQNENSAKLLEMGIETENIRQSPDNSLDQGVTVEHMSKKCIGQISVWKSGLMDVEILDIETENRLLYEHYEVTKDTNFDDILQTYVEIMKNDIVE